MEEQEKEPPSATTCFSCKLQPEFVRQEAMQLWGPPVHYTHKPTSHEGPFSAQPSPSVSQFAPNPSPRCASENQAVTSSQGILHLELK